MGFEFPKTARLLNRGQFQRTLDNGLKVVCPHLVVVGIEAPEGHSRRLGLIVSRKVGNAVIRNRIKRRLRERFRVLPSDVPVLDIVVIARPAAHEASGEELFAAFDQCLQRLLKKFNKNPPATRPNAS